jgi:hypothetical protein
MKKILLILLLILPISLFATTYYISTTGNNANAGTLAAPWRTLAFAGTNTVSGDIIFVLAGTFTETAPCFLKVGVSIDGAGVTSHIISTFTGECAISLKSNSDGTNGNQFIRNIKLSGSSLTGRKGIVVLARSNVKIYNITVQDFLEDGIVFKGAVGGAQPATYATGNELHDCIITNNSDRFTGGQGNIVATGYRGMLIYNNTLTQTSRPLGNNGNTFSATTEGFCEGLKFYNNKSYRNPTEVDNWSFHLELWSSQGGMEIYNNEFHNGAQMVDFGGHNVTKTSYAYAADVHHNLFQHDVPVQTSGAYQEVGVNIEGNCEFITVRDNYFKNMPYGVQLTCGHTDVGTNNITIKNNLFENGGYVNNEWGFDIDILGEGQSSTVEFINIYNNTFTGNSLSALYVSLHPNDIVSDIYFVNNIVRGIRSYGYITFANAPGTKTNYTVRNNLLYQNASSNGVSIQSGGSLPTGWNPIGNIIGNPLFDATFHLQAGSPAIDAGINVGLPFSGSAPDCGCFEYATIGTAPVANAGSDQNITLPTNSVSLAGSSTTTISTWNWTKVSGPAAGTITNATTPTSSAINLVQGVYKFELRVVNTSGLSDTDTMQVTVNAAPVVPPTCTGTGTSTITLPTSTAALVMTATSNMGGSIASYAWVKTSGPGAGTIQNATLPSTNAINLVQGTYVFTGTATETGVGTCTAVRTVIVNPAPNVNPTANAGADQNIQLPTTSVNIVGSGTDPDGTITGYLWTKVSGPAAGTITNAAIASTSITSLTLVGVYKYELRVTDNNGGNGRDTMQITVVAAANIPPVADAGVDKVITLPINTVSITGNGTDADGTIVGYAWTILSGPGTGSFSNATTANTSMINLVQGVYQIQLTVRDNSGSTDTDIAQVTVNAVIPVAPTCNSGTTPVTITPPTATVALAGTATTSPVSNGATYLWERTLPGSGGTIANATSLVTSVSGLQPSTTYNYRLTVTDNVNGLTCQSTKVVIVNATPIVPTANAGADQIITLPTSTVSLSGSGSGGTINSYQWTRISGPISGVFSTATSANTNFSGLAQGIYQVELRVGNSAGNFGRDTVQITVNPLIVLPTAVCSPDAIIYRPTNSVALVGTGTGTQVPLTYTWTRITGSGGVITNSNLASTTATSLTDTMYRYEFKVTDNDGNIAKDTFRVDIEVILTAPLVNAGADQTIYLPTTSTTLTGIITLGSGTITSYLWEPVTGAATTITTPTQISTGITGLAEGDYFYSLTVTTSDGFTVTNVVKVKVVAQNPLIGFDWFQGIVVNGKSNLKWSYTGATKGVNFTVQKKVLFFFWSGIGTVIADPPKKEYSFVDNSTGRTNTYRIKNGNKTSSELVLKK